jgi:hypothetical protein
MAACPSATSVWLLIRAGDLRSRPAKAFKEGLREGFLAVLAGGGKACQEIKSKINALHKRASAAPYLGPHSGARA